MFERSVGKKPGAVHRLLAHEHRGDDGREAGLGEVVERELVERHRDARRVADDVAEARAGDARCALHVEAADLRVLARLRRARAARRRGAAPPRRPPCRRRAPSRRGGFGTSASAASRAASAAASSSSASLSAALTGRQRLELLGCRLALELRLAAELVDARDERAPALVGLEQRVELLGSALARERRAPARRRRPGGLEVDHERESRKAGATCRRPTRRTPRRRRSAAR